MPIPMARKRERASLRRATAYSQNRLPDITKQGFIILFILIKDYTEDKSKDCGQKAVKAGQKPTDGHLYI